MHISTDYGKTDYFNIFKSVSSYFGAFYPLRTEIFFEKSFLRKIMYKQNHLQIMSVMDHRSTGSVFSDPKWLKKSKIFENPLMSNSKEKKQTLFITHLNKAIGNRIKKKPQANNLYP